MSRSSLLFFMMCLVPVGCASSHDALDLERRVTTLTAIQGLSPDVRAAILEGRIEIGMSQEMVAAAWGLPRFAGRETRFGHPCEVWLYGPRRSRGFDATLTFENGFLVSLETTPNRWHSAPWDFSPLRDQDVRIARSPEGGVMSPSH
jgi:hypothetical protein